MRVSRLLLLAQRKREAIRMPTGTAFLLPVFLRVLIKVHLSAALRGTSKPKKYTVGRNQNPGRYEPSRRFMPIKLPPKKIKRSSNSSNNKSNRRRRLLLEVKEVLRTISRVSRTNGTCIGMAYGNWQKRTV